MVLWAVLFSLVSSGTAFSSDGPSGDGKWVDSIFRSTVLCGQVPNDMQALLDQVAPLRKEPPTKKSVASLLDLLETFLKKNTVPIVGECSADMTWGAIDPAKLAELIQGKDDLVPRMEELARIVKTSDTDLAHWLFAVATLRGFESPSGKKNLDRVYQIWTEYYRNFTDEDSNPMYQKILKLKGITPERWTVLSRSSTACADGEEWSIRDRALPPAAEVEFFRLTLALTYSCRDMEETAAERTVTPAEMKPLLLQESYLKWLGKEGRGLAELLANCLETPSGMDTGKTDIAAKEALDQRYRTAQEQLRAILQKKGNLRLRTITGGC